MIDLKFPRLLDLSGRSMIDLPVAALAGLAVAFAAFTIPSELLADAVGASGLASVIPAAQPPLGSTARMTMALLGALAAFGGAFALLRWLDRFASRPAQAAPFTVSEPGPRLNRADSHPDAPPRRPISARRDLGEPAPPRPSQQWLDDLKPSAAGISPSASSVVRAAPAGAKAPPSASLGDLMARLEHGLAKRADTEVAAPAPASPVPPQAPTAPKAAPTPPPAPPRADDRLQSAIESLQRMAARR